MTTTGQPSRRSVSVPASSEDDFVNRAAVNVLVPAVLAAVIWLAADSVEQGVDCATPSPDGYHGLSARIMTNAPYFTLSLRRQLFSQSEWTGLQRYIVAPNMAARRASTSL